ncbi:hypothetical protein Tco_1063799, partial [Tanacetum coccineum]
MDEGNKHCIECNKDGHTREGCLKLIGYPKWWPKKKGERIKGKAACVGGESGPIPELTHEDYQHVLKHLSGMANGKSSKPTANMAHKEDVKGEWIIDSGCTEYITHLPNVLVNKKEASLEEPVFILTGESILVKGKGDHTLPGGAKVKGVLYISDFKCNLLSVSRLSCDLQCCISFFPDFYVMQGFQRRNLIGVGRCKGGLHRMKMVQGRRAMEPRLRHAKEQTPTVEEPQTDSSYTEGNEPNDVSHEPYVENKSGHENDVLGADVMFFNNEDEIDELVDE